MYSDGRNNGLGDVDVVANSDSVSNSQVVVLAGGKARRMGLDLPKCLLDISGKKLIDVTIESVKTNTSLKDFVFLLGYKHEMVSEHVGAGEKYGINAKYSIDPSNAVGWGKGKAFRYALENGKLDVSRRSLIAYPDDLVLDSTIYSKFLNSHIQAVKDFGVFASTVLVPGTEYPYGVAELDQNGLISYFVEKPMIEKPTFVGISIFEPPVYDIIKKEISIDDPSSPVELESVIMPYLANQRKLASFFIPSSTWLPINTIKEYENAIKVLARK